MNAGGDSVSMTGSVTFQGADDPAATATVAIGTGTAYVVRFGGVSKNDFFPPPPGFKIPVTIGIVTDDVACELEL